MQWCEMDEKLPLDLIYILKDLNLLDQIAEFYMHTTGK